MAESEDLKPQNSIDRNADVGEITVKRRRISVPTEEDISAISMLTPEDFILKDEKAPQKDDESESIHAFPDAAEPVSDDAEFEHIPEATADEDPLTDNEDTEFISTNIFDAPEGDFGEIPAEYFDEIGEISISDTSAENESSGKSSQECFDAEAAAGDPTDKKDDFYLLRGDEGEEPVVTLTRRNKRGAYNPDKPRKIDFIFDFVEIFAFSLVAVLIFTTFFFRHTIVEGVSMESTLYENEHLIISNVFYTPSRGDIIVCEDFSTGHRKPIVKRVIAVAGDTVEVLPTCIKVNGERLPEEYVYTGDYYGEYHNDDDHCRTWVIGEGEIFIMGDHRNQSDDSRKFGPVDRDSVLGKVLFRFYPFDRFQLF